MAKPDKPEKIKSVKEKFRDDPKKRQEYWLKRHGQKLTPPDETPAQPPKPDAPKP